MIEVKCGKLTHNFELMRNSNKSSITLSRAPHLEAEFNRKGGMGEGGLPAWFGRDLRNKKNNNGLKKFLFFRF